MNKKIDELYLDIAQRVADTIDDDWEKAIIEFQYYGDAAEYKGRYIESASSEEKDFKVGFKNYRNLKEIHKITTENDSNQWNKAKFTLFPTGKFNIDFEWDQSLADEIERLS